MAGAEGWQVDTRPSDGMHLQLPHLSIIIRFRCAEMWHAGCGMWHVEAQACVHIN